MASIMKILLIFSVVLHTCHNVQGARETLRANAWLNDVDGDNIPGKAGVDYPVHASVPPGTSFRCSDYDYAGYFGDQEADCQAYHVCFPDGRNASFLCVNGTVFHQRYFVCDWWFHFDCSGALHLYELNLFRKVPLPVLPPVARRPLFPGPAVRQTPPATPVSNPNRDLRKTPKRNSDIDAAPPPTPDRNGEKKNELLPSHRSKPENKYKNLSEGPKSAENKYKNPSEGPKSAENKYKNPSEGPKSAENKYKNPSEGPKSAEKCDCLCNSP